MRIQFIATLPETDKDGRDYQFFVDGKRLILEVTGTARSILGLDEHVVESQGATMIGRACSRLESVPDTLAITGDGVIADGRTILLIEEIETLLYSSSS